MPIEFNCQHCNKLLRVSDESAGARAKCPQCQSIMQIPAGGASQPAQGTAPTAAASNPFAQKPVDSANPYNSPSLAGTPKTKPINTPTGRIVPTAVEVGDVIEYAWEVWKSNLGLLVGITVVVFAINIGMSFVQGVVQGVLEANGDQNTALIVAIAISFISNVIQIFLGIGQVQIVLKLLRGQSANFGELFGGGPLFLRTLGASILFGIAMMLGFLLLIIPGILMIIFFWPFYYLIVDGKAKAIESFTMARPIAQQNVGTSIVLWLASLGIGIVGFIALCIGLLFATPLISTMWGTAYLMMSGQISTKPQRY